MYSIPLRAGCFALFISCLLLACSSGKKTTHAGGFSAVNNSNSVFGVSDDSLVAGWMAEYPGQFGAILQHRKDWNVQVIFTQIDRLAGGKMRFTDHFFNPDTAYFYPASTVKLPIAILALQKLQELNIPGLDRNSTMITEADQPWQSAVSKDSSAPDKRPTIGQYIKKILLVSDNDAFNRLYEFLGQEYINKKLHQMGYTDVQILHRLQVSMPDSRNRVTNRIRFLDAGGKVLYEKPEETSHMVYAARDTRMGKGFYRGDSLVNEPFDLSGKNRISLYDLHRILRSIIFPEAVPAQQRFKLSKDDYTFLRQYMSMFPFEAASPVYTAPEYWDTYVKFLLWGSQKGASEPGIRIFNKVGDAYGFLLDVAYIADFDHNRDLMVSAEIYCNSDGIFNDDHYDYDSIGFPFMRNLGSLLLSRELERPLKRKPDLRAFQFTYGE